MGKTSAESNANQHETTNHSFIIRIWLDGLRLDGEQMLWRGHITHVPSGDRRYMQDLDDIVRFIHSYLDS